MLLRAPGEATRRRRRPALLVLLSPLGGVAQRGPNFGHVSMDACRVMAAWTTVGPDKAYALISS